MILTTKALTVLLTVSLLSFIVAGCGTSPDSSDTSTTALSGQALRSFNQVEQEYLLHRDRQVLDLGRQLLAEMPDHAKGDEVLRMMVLSAIRLPDLDAAQELAMDFDRRYPDSHLHDEVLVTAARGLGEGGRPAEGLLILDTLVEGQSRPSQRQQTRDLATRMAADLETSELIDVLRQLDGRSLQPVVGNVLVMHHLEGGQRTEAEAVVHRLEVSSPDDPATIAARQSLTDGVRASVQWGRIGVLCPLTGRYARFGNAFQAGVRQAVDQTDPAGTQGYEVVLEDTQGDPVAAALATRALCDDEGCQVLIGAMLSSTTATAALVAERRGVPLVSPTATNEQLGRLGENVLQTNLTGPVEAEVLARLACEVLLKTRFAIIRPDTPVGANLAASFSEAVARYGGVVELEEIFDPAATDFRTQVHRVRAIRPEVVFAPATVDQMVLLGPQIDFFKVGALVLGPSEWNSERLMQRAGSVLERAVCAAPQVIYPASWSTEFASRWPRDQHDEEATNLARSAYLATRLALETLEITPEAAGSELTDELRTSLSGRDVDVAGPEGYAASVRLVRDNDLVGFPGYLYTEAWHQAAMADSLAIADSLAVADSLGITLEDLRELPVESEFSPE